MKWITRWAKISPASSSAAPLMSAPNAAAAQPARQVDASRGLRVATANHALEAALLGLGVALGDQVIMSQNLEDGTLIRPFSFSYPSPAQYYVVCERDRLHMPILRNFINWMFDTVGTEIEL